MNAPYWGRSAIYLQLIGKVVSVSLETVEIVEGLPELGVPEE